MNKTLRMFRLKSEGKFLRTLQTGCSCRSRDTVSVMDFRESEILVLFSTYLRCINPSRWKEQAKSLADKA